MGTICSICGRQYVYDRSKAHRRKTCNSCNTIKRRQNFKKKCVEYRGGRCIKCGYSKCLEALHFHHIDPREKEFTISRAANRSWNNVSKELDKCVILCANCHAEFHASLV